MCYTKDVRGIRFFTKAFWKSLFKKELPKSKSMPEESPSNPSKQPELFSVNPEPKKEEPVRKQGEKPKSELKPQTEVQKKDQSLIVRSELNLEQYAIFAGSSRDYIGKSREVIYRKELPTGEEIRQIIIGKTIDGISVADLTPLHFLVYLSLVELWEKAGRPIHENVPFTTLKIMKRLGMKYSGWEYERIKQWLYHLRQVPLEFRNSFFLKKEGSFKSLEPFTILSYLHIYERKHKDKKKEKKIYGYGEFQFDQHVLENLLYNYSHPLRLDVIKEFKKHKDTAILLYTYLDRCLAFRDKYEVRLELLFEHLDLSQRYIKYPSQRKKKLAPVLQELEGNPLSTGILSYCQIHKTEDGKDYKLVAKKTPYQTLLQTETYQT